MKRIVEIVAFLGLAGALHLLPLAFSAPGEGASASGAEGTEIVSLQAAILRQLRTSKTPKAVPWSLHLTRPVALSWACLFSSTLAEAVSSAVAALDAKKFEDEIVPLDVRVRENGGWRQIHFDTDEGPRADTTVEGLAKLKPVFDPRGTVTAGNASQINDGAAAVVIMGDDTAKEMGLEFCPPEIDIGQVRAWKAVGKAPGVSCCWQAAEIRI